MDTINQQDIYDINLFYLQQSCPINNRNLLIYDKTSSLYFFCIIFLYH